MARSHFLAALIVGALAFAPAAYAHHEGRFDLTQNVTVTGVLTAVQWQNPRAYFLLDVKKPDGTVEKWSMETAGPTGLRSLGLTDKGQFTVGATYTVEINPGLAGKRTGYLNTMTFPDGKIVKLGL